ncbi:TetR/AcrR family transcriptional regulator [Cohnella zeiphila]|uniref:TetR/AcrR family transcriptional regulator n=1 Tax=Cohnella zeiphila TaxID=2761120 RepID=A0A7X0W117_9BACL|nr:TetR/AcrR family transcriptional regulator [Cohnella zeiphila]MBB6735623.1 TetR/AcrR family transcriptional regulator [Cohnella zeiphila]
MGRQKQFDTDRALDAAMRLFWEKGYEAASMSELTAAMGVQRPSVYSAFGDKRELFEAALRKYTVDHAAGIRATLQRAGSVRQGFREVFGNVLKDGDSDRPARGCFCINTMVELAPHDERFEVLTREHQMYLAALFAEAIERGVRTGELKEISQPKALAETLVVALIGLTVLLKARPERATAERSAETILTLLR